MPKRVIRNDRRKSQRIFLVLPIRYRTDKDSSLRNALVCEDISGKGIRILTKEELKKRNKVEIVFSLPGLPKSITASCEVIWSKMHKSGVFRSGLRFIEIGQKDKFLEFLCDKLLEFSLKSP